MGSLLKYEFRKSMKMKAFVLAMTVICEIAFLIFVARKSENGIGLTATGLALVAICGVFLIGVYGIHTLSKDVNTKQAYMIFMTPNSSYKILGAKIIESASSILISGIFFIILAIIDVGILAVRFDDIKAFITYSQLFFKTYGMTINNYTFALNTLVALTIWTFTVVVGFLAVILCSSVLKGKRYNGFWSFIIFLIIEYALDSINDVVLNLISTTSIVESIIRMACYWMWIVIMYCVTAWIMDNKLSV